MDPVSNGASVIAFVGLALQSAKTLYDFFSAVKDGPQDVRRLVGVLHQLQATLERLSQCRALRDEPRDAVQKYIKSCNDDVGDFVNRLAGLKISDGDKRAGKYWKKIKIAFNEKALAGMGRVIESHTSSLTLWLNTLQSDAVFDSRDRLTVIDQRQGAIAQDQSQRWQTQQNAISEIGIDLAKLTEGVESMSSVSSSQAAQMMEMLRQIQQQLGHTTKTRHAPNSPQEHLSDTARAKQPDRGDEDLFNVVEQLCSLVDEKERTVTSEEAEDVIDGIQKLAAHLKKLGSQSGDHEDWEGRELVRDLKTLEGLALASQDIVLNKPGLRSSKDYRDGGVLTGPLDRKRKSFDVGYGEITITRTKRKGLRPGDGGDYPAHTEMHFLAEMSFLPKKQRGSRMFTFSVHRRAVTNDGFWGITHLSANNVLPASSLVFKLVKEGRMNEFQQMLRDGKASLRDHDEYGASLLHYGVSSGREMCRFLLDHGLDVDHVANLDGVGLRPRKFTGTPLSVRTGDARGKHDILRIQPLLEAGADPTFECQPYGDRWSYIAFLDAAVNAGDLERMKMCFSLASHFIDVESADLSGDTLLLRLCRSDSWNRVTVDFLIQQGANVKAKNYQGESCLHLCLRSAIPLVDEVAINGLLCLIQSGADVFAETLDGISVSKVAYTKTDDGSYHGDLWDCVLARSGYDVAKSRQGLPRVARYRHYYTRKDFKRMWRGIEHLCPYYDDEVREAPIGNGDGGPGDAGDVGIKEEVLLLLLHSIGFGDIGFGDIGFGGGEGEPESSQMFAMPCGDGADPRAKWEECMDGEPAPSVGSPMECCAPVPGREEAGTCPAYGYEPGGSDASYEVDISRLPPCIDVGGSNVVYAWDAVDLEENPWEDE